VSVLEILAHWGHDKVGVKLLAAEEVLSRRKTAATSDVTVHDALIEAMVATTKDSYHVDAINQFLGAAALEDGGHDRSTKYAWPNERVRELSAICRTLRSSKAANASRTD